MALNTRELYLVLKARDEASRAVRSFGGNLSKVAQLQKKLNLEQERSAQRLAAAKARYAEAQVRVEQAKTDKLVGLALKENDLNKLKVESDRKLLAQKTKIAAAQTRVAELSLAKQEEIANQTKIINAELAKSSDKRSLQVIRDAQKEIRAIRERADAAIRGARQVILAEKEIRATLERESVAEREAILKEIAAFRAKGDAAIAAAAKIAAASKEEIASVRSANAASIAAARNAVREQSRAEHAAQKRAAVGSSVLTGGVTAAATGLVALYALNKTTEAYTKYEQTVSLTGTQVDNSNRKIKISLQELYKTGIDVAKNMAVSFDQIQPMLYDIFSSIDTDGPGAAKILRQIGKDAVGGSVDMETAGRTILQILNAQLKGTNNVSDASDVLFQLVRKGVGTYKEFGSYIGASVPSAKAAGQSIQTLAGMMAFLTRVGLKVPAASASAGRAIDAIVRPQAIARLKDLGKTAENAIGVTLGQESVDKLKAAGVNFGKMSVAVADAHGNFRQMTDIAGDLNHALQGMSAEQKKLVLTEIFKGSGGTIQAMRFFNHAVNDSHGLLKQMTNDMYHAKGAAEEAYKAMSNTPEAKMQLLKNRFRALSIEVGQDLVPVKLKLVSVLAKIVGSFDRMSPRTRKAIAYFAAFSSVALVVIGILAILAGAYLVITSAISALSITLVGASAAFAEFIAVAATIYLLIKYHKQVEAVVVAVWHRIAYVLNPVSDAVKKLVPVFKKSIGEIVAALGDVYNYLKGDGKDVNSFFTTLRDTVKTVMTIIVAIIKFSMPYITNLLVGGIEALGPILKTVMTVVGGLLSLFNSMPGPAQTAVLALGAVAFASRGLVAAVALSRISVLANMSSMVSGVVSRAGGMKTALAGAAAGFAVGNLAGNVKGTSGKLLGALGGAASGAAIGAMFGGAPGAALGGLAGGITGLVTAWGKQKNAAKESAEAAQAALVAEKQAVDSVYDSLIAVNGQYSVQFKQQRLQQIQKSGVTNKADNLGFSSQMIADTLTNAKGSLDIGTLETKLGYFKIMHKAIDEYGGNLDKLSDHDKSVLGLVNDIDKLNRTYESGEQQYENYLKLQHKSLVSTKDLGDVTKTLTKYTNGTRFDLSAGGTRNNAVVKEYIDYYKKLAQSSVNSGKTVEQATSGYTANINKLKKALKSAGFTAKDIDIAFSNLGKIRLQPRVDISQIQKAAANANSIIRSIKQGKAPSLTADSTRGRAVIKSYTDYINAIRQGRVPGLTANSAAGRKIISTFNSLINSIKQNRVPSVTVDTSAGRAALSNLQTDLNNLANSAANKGTLIGSTLSGIAAGVGAGTKKNKAAGGWVFGRGTETSDSIPAMLSNNEFVVRAKYAKKNRMLLEAMNNGTPITVQKFAKGGSVTSTGNIKSDLYSLLLSLGITKQGAAGFLGNTSVESGFNLKAYNPRENAHGLQQWEKGRLSTLNSLAKKMHMSITSEAVQLAMIKKELTGGYKGTLKYLRNATDARSAAAYLDKNYERSSGSARGARMKAATGILNQIQSGNIKESTSSVSKYIPISVPKIKKEGKYWVFRGHKYSSQTAAENARNSYSRSAEAKAQREAASRSKQLTSYKNAVSQTGIPNLLYSLTSATPSEIHSRVSSLYKEIWKFGDKELDRLVKRNGGKLIAYANKRDKLISSRDLANSRLSELQNSKSSLSSNISSAITGTFDLSNESGSFRDIFGDLKSDYSDAVKFSRNIAALKKKGYSPEVIAALYARGPAANDTIAEMLKASPAQAKSFDRYYHSLQVVGTNTGNAVASNMYDVGINAAKGLVAGLNSQIVAIEKTMTTVANAMVAVIKKKLGIKSPSRVFHNVGMMTMNGLYNGLDKGFDDITSLMNNQSEFMSSSLLNKYKQKDAAVGYFDKNTNSGNTQVTFEAGSIVTQEIDPVKHAADLGWEFSRRVS